MEDRPCQTCTSLVSELSNAIMTTPHLSLSLGIDRLKLVHARRLIIPELERYHRAFLTRSNVQCFAEQVGPDSSGDLFCNLRGGKFSGAASHLVS